MSGPETDEALAKLLGDLHGVSDKLQASAPELWRMAVRQQYIDGSLALATGTVCLAIAAWVGWRCWRKDKDGDYELEIELRAGAFLMIVGLTIAFALCLNDGLPKLLNADYYAVYSLSRLVK